MNQANDAHQPVPTDPQTGKPYLNTVASVTIAPSGVGPELSQYVAQVVDIIRRSGLPNETNAMATNIEGDLDQVLAVVREATVAMAGKGYRTGVSLKLDIRPGFHDQMKQKTQVIEDILHSMQA